MSSQWSILRLGLAFSAMLAVPYVLVMLPESGLNAQIQALIRANDPMWEMLFIAGIVSKMEDSFWEATLRNLTAEFSTTGTFTLTSTRVDPRWQWAQAKNIWHNAAIRSTIYLVLSPFRWVGGMFAKRGARA